MSLSASPKEIFPIAQGCALRTLPWEPVSSPGFNPEGLSQNPPARLAIQNRIPLLDATLLRLEKLVRSIVNLDAHYRISLRNRIHNILAGDNLSKYRVLVVKPPGRNMRDEKLAAIGSRPRVGHRKDARLAMGESRVKLILEFVPRPTTTRPRGVATLNHEILDDPMKNNTIVVTTPGQIQKIRARHGNPRGKNVQRDVPPRGFQCDADVIHSRLFVTDTPPSVTRNPTQNIPPDFLVLIFCQNQIYFSMIRIKRVYEAPDDGDGFRVLVDRVWPRGISKERANLGAWLKEVAPSTELRKWYAHEEEKFPLFEKKYVAELKKNPAVQRLRELASQHKTLTLVFSAKSPLNQAKVLSEFLRGKT